MARCVSSRSSYRPARRRRSTTISPGGSWASTADETIYERRDDGSDPARAQLELTKKRTLDTGEFYTLLPPTEDIHFVQTVSGEPSISIHLLANDTACVWRHKFDPASGAVVPFRSGYSNAPCPPEMLPK